MPQHSTRVLLRNEAKVAGHDAHDIHGTSFWGRDQYMDGVRGHFVSIVVPARSCMQMRQMGKWVTTFDVNIIYYPVTDIYLREWVNGNSNTIQVPKSKT